MEKEKQFSEIKREILLSIKPEHLVKILNGEKTLEIRKTMPKCEVPCRVRLYCTKPTNYYRIGHMIFNTDDLWYHPVKKTYICDDSYELMCLPDGYTYTKDNFLNCKVVGSFILKSVRCFEAQCSAYDQNSIYEIKGGYSKYLGELQNPNLELLKESCLSSKQLEKYIQDKNGDIIDKRFYGWCISDLNILDKPFDLWNDGYFGNPKTKLRILKAPQSWCYCKYDKDGFLPF